MLHSSLEFCKESVSEVIKIFSRFSFYREQSVNIEVNPCRIAHQLELVFILARYDPIVQLSAHYFFRERKAVLSFNDCNYFLIDKIFEFFNIAGIWEVRNM